MGPLFACAFLAIAGVGATLVVFVMALSFLPIRSALMFAPIFVGAGMAGCGFGVVVQFPFLHGETGSTIGGLAFLAIAGLMGCAGAFVFGVAFLRLRRRILARFDHAAVAHHFD
jgi:hypothetical protein